jgi:uncharacterized protein (TIGR02271 family)
MADDFTLGNLRRLSDADFTVADNEPDVRGWTVVSRDGRTIGEVDDLIVDTAAMKVRFLEVDPDEDVAGNGTEPIYIPIANADVDNNEERLVLRGDAAAVRGLVPSDFASHFSASTNTSTQASRGDRGGAQRLTRTEEEQRLTRAEEEVRIGKRAVEGGEVRVGKHVETEHVRDQVDVTREQVHIDRRPVTDARGAAEIGAATDEIRVPIVEEEVVVEKRPVVKEELVISKEQVHETRPVDVEVRKEQFDIEDDRNAARDRSADERIARKGDR